MANDSPFPKDFFGCLLCFWCLVALRRKVKRLMHITFERLYLDCVSPLQCVSRHWGDGHKHAAAAAEPKRADGRVVSLSAAGRQGPRRVRSVPHRHRCVCGGGWVWVCVRVCVYVWKIPTFRFEMQIVCCSKLFRRLQNLYVCTCFPFQRATSPNRTCPGQTTSKPKK